MSETVITNIESNGNILFSKPLLLNNNLTLIKEKIKNKVISPFLFLDKSGKPIEKEKEDRLKLEDIIFEEKIQIKIIQSGINIFLNDKNICSIELPIDKNLDSIRIMISDKIKGDFTFLDSNLNSIDIEDEKEYPVKCIIKNNEIKLKGSSIKEINNHNSILSNSNDNKEIKSQKKKTLIFLNMKC